MKNKILKKMTAFFVCATLVVGIIPPANSAWDGYPKPETGENVVLVDNNNISNIIAAKGKPSTKNVKSGERYSAHWDNHTVNTTLTYSKVERDWSICNEISFDIYSEEATGAIVAFMVYADYVPTPGKTISYFLKTFKLDFEGWKHITMKPADFTNGNFADWAKINKVQFIASGWGATPNEKSDIYISSVYGTVGSQEDDGGVESMQLSDKTKADVLSKLGKTTAVMNFAGNAVKDGKVTSLELSEKISTDENGSIAPFAFFENVLGAKISEEGIFTLDGKTADLSQMTLDYDGVKYLPLNDALKALGKTAVTSEMVTLISDDEKGSLIADDAQHFHKLKILLNANSLSESDVTKEDWKELKDKWRVRLLGDENKDINDEVIASKLKAIDSNCKGNWKNMNKETEILALFGKTPVTLTTHMTNQYAMLLTMARAYGTYGCEYYKDPQLKRDIMFALDWLYENLYGKDEMNNTGWKSMRDYDWWDWFVGTPANLCEILLIMEDELNPKLIEKYLEPFLYAQTILRTNLGVDTAASRVYGCTLAAALLEDFTRMTEQVTHYNLMLKPVEEGMGVQEDGLYITHEYFAYSAAYGSTSLLDRLTAVESILGGTKFEFATPYKYNSCKWMYETFAPIMFNGAITSAQSGRFRASAQFTETQYISYAIASMIDFIGVFGKDDDVKLKQLIKRNVIDENKSAIISRLEIDQATTLVQILEDTSIPEEPYYKSKVYYSGDSVAHQRDDFGFAVAMSSSRIAAWESIGGTNITGWYQGDGMLYTYMDNDPNAYNYNYWMNVNPYHLPGTTVDTQTRTPASISDSSLALTKEQFVGGAQMDEEYSVAAMQLRTHNSESLNPNVTTIAPGGDAPNHKSSLVAKKAYFLFDDEAVALGADINADDGYEVQTVVENRRLNKTEKKATAAANAASEEYDVVGVTASADDGNSPYNTIDGNYDTRWSAQSDAHIIYELPEAVPVGYVGIAQYNGTDGKQAIFELEISTDGFNWTKVWEGKASGTTTSMEAYDMKGTVAKYVKYQGHGRTNSEWNSVTEFKIFAPTADGSMPVDGKASDDRIYGAEKITVDGNLLKKESNYKKSFNNPSWVHIENASGYFFPEGGKLVMDKVTNKENFLEMWLSHDVSPKKGTYSYVVLPKKSAEETAQYAANADIEILSNNEKLQAVREKTLGVLGMVFWEKGSFEDVEASVPCIIMTKKTGEEYQLNVSDPTKLLTEGTITLNGNYTLLESDKRCTVTAENGKTIIKINFDGAKGRTLSVKLK